MNSTEKFYLKLALCHVAAAALVILFALLFLGCSAGGAGLPCYDNHTCDDGKTCLWGWRGDFDYKPGICVPQDEVHIGEWKYRAPTDCPACTCPDAGTRAPWR